MKIYKTGHEIADTVAESLEAYAGDYSDAHIAYGILRGTADVYKPTNKWFEVDNGYLEPGHFHGNYRISYKGTQAKWHEGIPQIDSGIRQEEWKDNIGYILVCPPTEVVARFFNIDYSYWFSFPIEQYKIRFKNDPAPIDWPNIKGVITFNSSIGWQALQRGIPCISDTEHSLVGSYHKHELVKLGLDYTFENVKKISTEALFNCMAAHQFTLAELQQGKAWPLLQHYLSLSASTQEKQQLQK